jgi:hypothetical protein
VQWKTVKTNTIRLHDGNINCKTHWTLYYYQIQQKMCMIIVKCSVGFAESDNSKAFNGFCRLCFHRAKPIEHFTIILHIFCWVW